jgi:hypothetical protein
LKISAGRVAAVGVHPLVLLASARPDGHLHGRQNKEKAHHKRAAGHTFLEVVIIKIEVLTHRGIGNTRFVFLADII